MQIYLASSSPRRRELLEKAGYKIEIIKSGYDEKNEVKNAASDMVMEQARGKAVATEEKYREEGIVIGADTIVVLDGNIMGKPTDEKEAFSMLRALSRRTHEVITGVSLISGNLEDTFYVSTLISFREVSDAEIEEYIATGSPMDKAGAYGLQDIGDAWMQSMKGSLSNVIGLPMEAVEKRLKLFTK